MQLSPSTPTILLTRKTSVPSLDFNLSPEAPTTLVAVVATVPALDVNLSPEAPTILLTRRSVVPALDINLSPEVPAALRTRLSSGVALDINLSPEAPTTSVILAGTTQVSVPSVGINVSPEVVTTLRTLIAAFPALDINLGPVAPTIGLPSAQTGDGDGTSGGNYGRILPPLRPSKKKPRTVTDNVVPLREEELEEPLRDFSQILEALEGIKDSPLPPTEEVTRILARFEPVEPEQPLRKLDLLEYVAKIQAQNLEILAGLENRIFLELGKIRDQAQEDREALRADIRGLAEPLRAAFEAQSIEDQRRILAILEAEDEAERDRLLALLAALSQA